MKEKIKKILFKKAKCCFRFLIVCSLVFLGYIVWRFKLIDKLLSIKYLIDNNMGIISLLFSPLIAVVVGDMFRRKNFEKQKRLEVLYNLIAYRDELDSEPFLKSLNSLKVLFSKDKELKKMINDLYFLFSERDKGKITNEPPAALVVFIIKRVCDLEGFKDITTEEIKKVFKKIN